MSSPTPPEISTIVRPKLSGQLAAMRSAFRVLDTFAPGLAAKWATDLWFTLPKNHGRRRDHRISLGAISMIPLSRGRRVVAERWGAGPPVYLVHGWGGWRGQLGAFVEPLAAGGFSVIGFDVPSHGESPPGDLGPGKSSPDDAFVALRAVAERYGHPAGIVAHSLGAITTLTALQDGQQPHRMAFVAPSPSPVEYSAYMARSLGYGERTRSRLLGHVERLARRPLEDVDIISAPQRMDLPPTLVVHDRADKEIPYAESVRLSDAWPTAALATTDGLGHQRILADPEVIKQVVGFIAAQS